MQATRLLGRKYNLNIIYPLIGVNGLGKMAHWIDYIGSSFLVANKFMRTSLKYKDGM